MHKIIHPKTLEYAAFSTYNSAHEELALSKCNTLSELQGVLRDF